MLNVIIIFKAKYKIKCKATQNPDKCQGRTRSLGRVSITCWPVTTGVSHICISDKMNYPKSKFSMSRLGIRNKAQSKLVCQEQVTQQSAENISVSKPGQWNNSQKKVEITRTSGYNRGRIRCLGGVSILCWLVTPTVRPWSKLDIRDIPSSKPV
jgi:hypothetical protein